MESKIKIKSFYLTFFLTALLSACSGLQQSEEERVKKQNLKVERLQRSEREKLAELPRLEAQPRELYPWERAKGSGDRRR